MPIASCKAPQAIPAAISLSCPSSAPAGAAASASSPRRFIVAADSPLLANMAALWAADPDLAREMEEAIEEEAYPIEPTRSGEPTIALNTPDGRRIYLHSRYRPTEEARKLVESPELDEKTVFCVHGFGLGYHIDALFERGGDEAVIVVFEPDPRLLRTAFECRDFSKMILSGRVMILTRADRPTLMLKLGSHQALVCVGLAFLSHGPSMQVRPDFHRQVQTVMGEYAAYARTSINTLVLNGRRTCENVARNLGWYVAAPGVGRLKGRHAGQPAIIVSAGPSLRKNRRLLASAQGKAVLIAVQTTLQPLVEMGIEPQYATSLDYHEICARFFEKLPRKLNTELVAEPKAASVVLSLYPGKVSLLGSEYADRLVREMQDGKARLRSGATVAHLAFYLAEHMGCDPIIFVGQDLGFSDGLCYAPGTSYEDVWRPELGRFCTMEMRQWEHIVRERPILRKVQDWEGRGMYTEERLFAYLQQFERDFATSPARIIDATEGGCRKAGATPMTLAEAIDKHCVSPLPAVPDDHPGFKWERLGVCLESLRKRSEEAERIREIGRQTLPLLEEVRDNLEDQGRVNRAIARIDGLRARMKELDECYALVSQFTQKTELVRFQNDRRIASSRVSGIEKQRQQIARDMLNVQAIVDAAGELLGLVDEVISVVEEQRMVHAAFVVREKAA